MSQTFHVGQRVWGRHTGWYGAIFVVEAVSEPDEVGVRTLTLRSTRSGRSVRRPDFRMVPVLPVHERLLPTMRPDA